jgi:predicted regulator of Ras-like GTPase activity (Roadblock/LC7/MglB family)
MLQSILGELNGSSKAILASSVLSIDGMAMAVALPDVRPQPLDEDKISALSAALACCGHKAARELTGGSLDWLLVKGEAGDVLITCAGPEIVLTALIKPGEDEDPVFSEMKRAADSIREFALPVSGGQT